MPEYNGESPGWPAAPPSELSRWLRGIFWIEGQDIDPTLSGVMGVLWRKRLIILAFALAGALAGFLTASLTEKKYVASMRLIPNIDNTLGGSSHLSLGGLSSLAGGLAKPEDVTLFQQYLAVMASPEVAREMQRRGNFLSKLYPELWDTEKHDWRPPPSDIFAVFKRAIRHALNLPTPPHPTYEYLAKDIAKRVGVTEASKTSIYTISFADKDPTFARNFIQALYASTEAVLLRRDRSVAERRIQAAENELAKTTITSSREALTEIMVMFNLRMIQINVGPPYAAKILSGTEVSDFPSIPNVAMYVGVGFVAGLLLASFILGILALARARKTIP